MNCLLSLFTRIWRKYIFTGSFAPERGLASHSVTEEAPSRVVEHVGNLNLSPVPKHTLMPVPTRPLDLHFVFASHTCVQHTYTTHTHTYIHVHTDTSRPPILGHIYSHIIHTSHTHTFSFQNARLTTTNHGLLQGERCFGPPSTSTASHGSGTSTSVCPPPRSAVLRSHPERPCIPIWCSKLVYFRCPCRSACLCPGSWGSYPECQPVSFLIRLCFLGAFCLRTSVIDLKIQHTSGRETKSALTP